MNSESFVQCLTLTVACILSSYAPLRVSGCVFSILWPRRPSRGACAASIHENSPNILPRSKEGAGLWSGIAVAFSPHLWVRSAERPPHLRLNEGGVVPVHYNDIQAPIHSASV